jgi:integrase
MHAPFSVVRRTLTDKNTGKTSICLEARFFDESGAVVKTKRLNATNKTAAVLEAKRLLDKGAGSRENPPVLDFLLDFWRIDSDYAKMKALKGRPLSVGYIRTNASAIKNHLSGPFVGLKLLSLNSTKMEKAILSLADNGMSPRMINYTVQAVRVAVTDWARKRRIPDPLEYIGRAAETPKERGTLTAKEVGKIIALEVESPRGKAAVLLGCLCGLRLGECRGLLWGDVDGETIKIVHNYVDEKEGLKGPKCGSRRTVPIPSAVRSALELCRATAPRDTPFILWNEKKS